MKKFKKVLSTVLALSMLPMTGIMHASAAHEFSLAENKYKAASWSTLNVVSDKYSDTWDDYVYMEPTAKDKHDGKYSWHISNNAEKDSGGTYTQTSVATTETLLAGSYYVSFWQKGFGNDLLMGYNLNNRTGINCNCADWTQVEFVMTATSDITKLVITNAKNTDVFIDDIELYKATPNEGVTGSLKDTNLENYTIDRTKNYIKNGDVEDVSVQLTYDLNNFSLPEGKYKATYWSAKNQGVDKMTNVEYNYGEPTTDEKYSGKYSWHMQNAMQTKPGNVYTSHSINISKDIEQNSSYYVSYMRKGYSGSYYFRIGWTAYKEYPNVYSGDWEKIEHIYTPTSTDNWISFINEINTDMYIDDLEMYKVTVSDASDYDFKVGETYYKKADDTNYITDGGIDIVSPIYNLSDNEVSNYRFMYWSDILGNAANDVDANYIRPTKKYARTGNYAAYLKGSEWKGTDNNYVVLETPFSVSASKEEYVVEFWGKTDISGSNIKIGPESGWWSNEWKAVSSFTKTETDDNDWVHYKSTITPTENSTKIWIMLDGTIGDMVIDDLTIYKASDETKTNIVPDGGFEKVNALPANEYKLNNWIIFVSNAKQTVTNEDKSTTTLDVNCVPEYREAFVYAEPTKDEKHNGEYSLHVSYPHGTRGDKTGNSYVYAKPKMNLPTGTYYVSYWKKGIHSRGRLLLEWGPTEHSIAGAGSMETGNEWVHDEYILTTSNDYTWGGLIFDQWSDMYIDDFEIYAVEKENADEDLSLTNYKKVGENLVTNGDCEDVIENVVEINLTATPIKTANALDVAWVNPNRNNITDISIYADGTKFDATVDKTANAANSVTVTGLTNGKATEIELVISFANGKTASFKTTGTPDDLGGTVSYGSWKYTRIDGTHGDAVIDTNEFDGGKASLRMDINLPNVTADTYVKVNSNDFILEGGSTYTLNFRYKAENVKKFSVAFDGPAESTAEDWVYRTIVWGDTKNVSTDGWKNCEIKYTPSDYIGEDFTTKLVFALDAGEGSVWIDDIAIYGTDDFGDSKELNIIEDNGFEFDDYTISSPNYNLVAEDGTKTAITEIQKGTIEVTSKIKNNAMGDNFKAAMIVALYKGNALVSVAKDEKIVSEKPIAYPQDEFTASVVVPEDNGYTLKVMWWKGLDSATPFREADGI